MNLIICEVYLSKYMMTSSLFNNHMDNYVSSYILICINTLTLIQP